MKTLLIVFHSVTGGARQMAEAAVQGAAAESEVETRLVPFDFTLGGEQRRTTTGDACSSEIIS